MNIRNTKTSYGLVSILLHWLMAVILTGLFFTGLYMTSLDYYDPLYHRLPHWHKSLGVIAISLLLIRLSWNAYSSKPGPLKSHKKTEVLLAHSMQSVIYILIILIVLTGYLISTAKGKAIELFNWFNIPAFINIVNGETVDLTGKAHLIIAYLFITLVTLHAIAALKHHFIDKDNTFKRMTTHIFNKTK